MISIWLTSVCTLLLLLLSVLNGGRDWVGGCGVGGRVEGKGLKDSLGPLKEIEGWKKIITARKEKGGNTRVVG